jgi:hypothetical protein
MGIYPVREPNYNPRTHCAGPLQLDRETHCITRRVYEFARGIAHSWKAREFNPDGSVFRPTRARVLWADTLTGGMLAAEAHDMVVSGVPSYRTHADGHLAEATGEYVEVYLNWVAPADEAKLLQYVALRGGGCVYEHYTDLP